MLLLVLVALAAWQWGCQRSAPSEVEQPRKLKALIIDGENNHGVWPKTTMMMKDFLEETGLFEVDIRRKAYTWQGPHHNEIEGVTEITHLLAMYPLEGVSTQIVDEPQYDPDFDPDFSGYDVVVSNLGWKATDWPEGTQRAFEQYVDNGGGLIIVHAANNCFGHWDAYNRMIGFGGWGGRSDTYGAYLYYDDHGDLHRDTSAGPCGSHGPQYEFLISTREPDHPIMKGLPMDWLHTKDELYDRMRGPTQNMTVLATSYSDLARNAPPWNKDVSGTGRHEPMLSVIEFGRGRVFHTVLGHMDYSMECVGFITTLQRGAEWVATGKVTQDVPSDFPTTLQSSARPWKK